MDILLKALLAASLTAAALGILYWLLKKPSSEQRWHIFFTVFEKEDDTFSPLYRVGSDVGSRSIPALLYDLEFEWEVVTGAGYISRDKAIQAAKTLEDAHLRDLAALPQSDDHLRDPDSTLFLPRMAE